MRSQNLNRYSKLTIEIVLGQVLSHFQYDLGELGNGHANISDDRLLSGACVATSIVQLVTGLPQARSLLHFGRVLESGATVLLDHTLHQLHGLVDARLVANDLHEERGHDGQIGLAVVVGRIDRVVVEVLDP